MYEFVANAIFSDMQPLYAVGIEAPVRVPFIYPNYLHLALCVALG